MFEYRSFRLIRNLNRSRQIVAVLLRFGFDDVLERLPLRRYVRWGRRVLLRQDIEPIPRNQRARRIRLALESLGATFIKFGQVISTRPDLIPQDVIEELSLLQENVPPFSSEAARLRLREELGKTVDDLFAEFDDQPIAAGSLAQVHRAKLHDGTELAVKIRRPGVVRVVERDLSLMEEMARLVERSIPESAPFDPVGLVQHFAKTIRRELNFYREARNIEEFGRLFQKDATLYVPQVYWQFCTETILVMEFIRGHRITDPQKLREVGIRPEDIAANGARIFMKQAFVNGLFHGDPHPGNLRVLPDGTFCLLDFGMVGILDDERREQLVDLFLAISRKDVRSAVDSVLTIGSRGTDSETHLLRADLRDFINNYYNVSLERLRVGKLLTDFMAILSEHQIRCPPNLMLLIRAIVALEGVGRELDPGFNLAGHLAPFVERLVRDRYNPKTILQRMTRETGSLMHIAREFPHQIHKTLDKLNRDDLHFHMHHEGLKDFKSEIDRVSNRVVVGVVLSALIVASAIIITSGAAGNLVYSIPIFLSSSLLGMWLIYGIFRSGRL